MERFKFYFVSGVDLQIQRNKRGQTPSPVMWTEIQTCCNIPTSSYSYYLLLVDWYSMCVDVPLECYFGLNCGRCPPTNFADYLCFLLRKDLSEAPTASTSSARVPTGDSLPKTSSFKYSAIQEVSFQRIVGAICIGHLLYSFYRIRSYISHTTWPI